MKKKTSGSAVVEGPKAGPQKRPMHSKVPSGPWLEQAWGRVGTPDCRVLRNECRRGTQDRGREGRRLSCLPGAGKA